MNVAIFGSVVVFNFGKLNCLTFDQDVELATLLPNGGFVESHNLVCTRLYFDV